MALSLDPSAQPWIKVKDREPGRWEQEPGTWRHGHNDKGLPFCVPVVEAASARWLCWFAAETAVWCLPVDNAAQQQELSSRSAQLQAGNGLSPMW